MHDSVDQILVDTFIKEFAQQRMPRFSTVTLHGLDSYHRLHKTELQQATSISLQFVVGNRP